MSSGNGVIRIGKKGLRKFAFGDEGAPFTVDVVVAFQQWILIDDEFRTEEREGSNYRTIPLDKMLEFQKAAADFVRSLAASPLGSPVGSGGKPPDITTAEALDFIARLREEYDELADFFVPRSREERASPDTSAAELRFSVEESGSS